MEEAIEAGYQCARLCPFRVMYCTVVSLLWQTTTTKCWKFQLMKVCPEGDPLANLFVTVVDKL